MGNSFDSICSNQSQGTVPATEACSRACHLRLYLFYLKGVREDLCMQPLPHALALLFMRKE